MKTGAQHLTDLIDLVPQSYPRWDYQRVLQFKKSLSSARKALLSTVKYEEKCNSALLELRLFHEDHL